MSHHQPSNSIDFVSPVNFSWVTSPQKGKLGHIPSKFGPFSGLLDPLNLCHQLFNKNIGFAEFFINATKNIIQEKTLC
jgi:hypothetical protein